MNTVIDPSIKQCASRALDQLRGYGFLGQPRINLAVEFMRDEIHGLDQTEAVAAVEAELLERALADDLDD